jgi:hypothetical protein
MTLDQPIALQGELTLKDARRGIRLATFSWRRMTVLIVAAAVVFVFVIVLGGIGLSARDYDQAAGNRILVVVFVALPLLLLLPFALYRYRLYQAWKVKTGIFDAHETIISADGLSTRTDNSQIHIQWTFFTSYRHSDRVLVLYHRNGWLFFARARFGSDAEWKTFVSFVKNRFAVAA